MVDRKVELDLRLRANAGRKRRQGITSLLRSSLGLPPQEAFAIDLEHSDAIRGHLAMQNEKEELIPMRIWQIVPSQARHITLVPQNYRKLFFLPVDVSQVGIFVVSADAISKRWISILDEEPDGFQITLPSLMSGVVVDKICEWPLWKEVVEIRAWGVECVDWLTRQNIVSLQPKEET